METLETSPSPSTTHPPPPAADLTQIKEAVKALETRVTAMMGKAHRDSLQFPGGHTIHNICNRVELHRKRLHDVEEMKGASKLVKMLMGKSGT